MLHILLLILKILGIIIAAILGILVLLICIVLFVPIRYEISAKCDGTIESLKAKGRVTWLLHLIRADFYFKEKQLKWKLRIAWIKKTNQLKKKIRKEDEPNEKTKKSETTEETLEKNQTVETGEKLEEKLDKTSENVQQEESQKDAEKNESIVGQTSERISENKEDSKAEKETLHQKIEKLINKIKCTFKDICDKIKVVLEKKEKLTGFIKDEVHVKAYQKTKKSLLILLKRLKPKTTEIRARFGFEDPYLTGQVLAGLSVIYPIIGGVTEIYPDF